MIGLPARGKSYISKKLRRYLRWIGYNTKVYNVGDHRREVSGASCNASYFDKNNTASYELRNKIAQEVLGDMCNWLVSDEAAHVAIHDATNSSKTRRNQIQEILNKHKNVSLLWIESICTDSELIQENIKLKTKSPDYIHVTQEEALKDFRERLKNYEAVYETLDSTDSEKSYIKLINVGRQVLANNIRGYLQSLIVTFLMNYHVHPRDIYITRHGESVANTLGLLGGDSVLSEKGLRYAAGLGKFMKIMNIRPAELLISTLQRTRQTARFISEGIPKILQISGLNEIYAGSCEGMTYKQVEQQMPEEFEARSKDKLRYRYPGGGESYMDLIHRIKPVVIELERQRDTVMIVGHQAVLRTLIGYFINSPKHTLPHLDVPLHTVFKLTPTPHGCHATTYTINLDKFDRGDDVFWDVQEQFHSAHGTHDYHHDKS